MLSVLAVRACTYSLNLSVFKTNTLPAITNLNCTYTWSANNEHCCEWSHCCRIDPSVTIIPLLVTTQVLGPTSLTLFGNYHEMHAYCPNRAKPAPAYFMNSNVKHSPRYMDSQVPSCLSAVWHELQPAYVFQSRLGRSGLYFDPTRHTWAPPQHWNRRSHAWRAA